MKAILTVVLALGCLSGVTGAAQMARADGGVTVRMPDVSGLDDDQAQALLTDLAKVNVITSNCPAYQISNGEWTLITATGDVLATRLGLDARSYDQKYYGPAFKLLEDPGACDRIGPTAKPLIRRLIQMGGGTTPLTQSQ